MTEKTQIDETEQKFRLILKDPNRPNFTLTYTGFVVEEDDHFVTFLDKVGIVWRFNKSQILMMEALK